MDGRLDGGDGPGPIGVRPANLAARRIRIILRIRHLGDKAPFRLAADSHRTTTTILPAGRSPQNADNVYYVRYSRAGEGACGGVVSAAPPTVLDDDCGRAGSGSGVAVVPVRSRRDVRRPAVAPVMSSLSRAGGCRSPVGSATCTSSPAPATPVTTARPQAAMATMGRLSGLPAGEPPKSEAPKL